MGLAASARVISLLFVLHMCEEEGGNTCKDKKKVFSLTQYYKIKWHFKLAFSALISSSASASHHYFIYLVFFLLLWDCVPLCRLL